VDAVVYLVVAVQARGVLGEELLEVLLPPVDAQTLGRVLDAEVREVVLPVAGDGLHVIGHAQLLEDLPGGLGRAEVGH